MGEEVERRKIGEIKYWNNLEKASTIPITDAGYSCMRLIVKS